MIRINLAPPEELENKYWFLPDVAIVVGLAIAFSLASYAYLDYLDKEILQNTVETAENKSNTKALEPAIKELKQHKERIAIIKDKIHSLENITVSKTEKYRSAILLEHLQNIKPEGVWFTKIVENTKDSTIAIDGGAFDNITIAEFMSALESTRYQESEASDLRTQIYFNRVELGKISVASGSQKSSTTSVSVKDKSEGGGDSAEEEGQGNREDIYQGYESFPTFDLLVKYATREAISLKSGNDEFKL